MFDISQKVCTALAAFALYVVTVSPVCLAGEQKKTNTVVTVSEMCGGCVKKITKRFDEEKDVAKVDCNIENKAVPLTPTESVQLSAKKIWEIMEGISQAPTKLVSPEGTFIFKPK